MMLFGLSCAALSSQSGDLVSDNFIVAPGRNPVAGAQRTTSDYEGQVLPRPTGCDCRSSNELVRPERIRARLLCGRLVGREDWRIAHLGVPLPQTKKAAFAAFDVRLSWIVAVLASHAHWHAIDGRPETAVAYRAQFAVSHFAIMRNEGPEKNIF
jgi:hypothetical protein